MAETQWKDVQFVGGTSERGREILLAMANKAEDLGGEQGDIYHGLATDGEETKLTEVVKVLLGLAEIKDLSPEKVALQSPNPNIRLRVLSQIHSPVVLAQVCIKDSVSRVSAAALERLIELGEEETLAGIAMQRIKGTSAYHQALNAVKGITNPAELKRVFLGSGSDNVRREVFENQALDLDDKVELLISLDDAGQDRLLGEMLIVRLGKTEMRHFDSRLHAEVIFKRIALEAPLFEVAKKALIVYLTLTNKRHEVGEFIDNEILQQWRDEQVAVEGGNE